MFENKTLTVFTPVYNRIKTLPRLYESLKNQTDKDFVWMVVDDGSVDGSDALIREFQAEGAVDTVFIKQENGGKHVAHNRAVEECSTQLFVCLDSDDWLTADAVEFINTTHRQNADKNCFAYISPRMGPDGNVPGKNFYEKDTFAGFHDLYTKQKYQGETMIVFVAEKLKKFAFPVFENEKFLAENALYYQFGNPKTMFLPKSVYGFEYRSDGLSLNITDNVKKNPKGVVFNSNLTAVSDFIPFLSRVRSAANFYALKKYFGTGDVIGEKKIPFTVAAPALILQPLLRNRIKKRFGQVKKS